MQLANKHTTKLKTIKENISESWLYSRLNRERYKMFMRFAYSTTLDSGQKGTLKQLNKPPLEFNILEPAINVKRADFAKNVPHITARAADGVRIEDINQDFMKKLEVLQWHLNEVFANAQCDGTQYDWFSQILGGGFSVGEVTHEYVNPMSFEQNIKIEQVFDPCLTGFDSLARESHKGDGRFCYKLIPKLKEEFEQEYGEKATKGMKFEGQLGDFSWSYRDQKEKIVLLCEYYYKNRKKEKIVKLSNGHTVLKKKYQKFLAEWSDAGFMQQAPIIIDERWTYIDSIERYTLAENEILEHKDTDFAHLPLVFFDGNSVMLQESETGGAYQMTRPYIYQAIGTQKLMNFAGQTVAGEIENMVMHKWVASLESIPESQLEAFKNPQQAATLLYNEFHDGNPEVRLTPPREIMRTPTPPIVESTFMGTSNLAAMTMGNYNLVDGDRRNSEKAIGRGAIQAGAAADPFYVSYIRGLTRVAEIVTDLIPKFYVTPRSLPIRKSDGKRGFQIINHPDHPESIQMNYDPMSVQIKVEAGVNLEIQRQMALEQMSLTAQAFPNFAQFMNAKGLDVILDNLDIRGIEGLKEKIPEYEEEMQQAAQKQAEQGDPMLQAAQQQIQSEHEVEMAKVEQRSIEAEGNQAIQSAKVAIEEQKVELQYYEIMAKLDEQQRKGLMEQRKIDSGHSHDAIELSIKLAEHMRGDREQAH